MRRKTLRPRDIPALMREIADDREEILAVRKEATEWLENWKRLTGEDEEKAADDPTINNRNVERHRD